MIIFGGVKQSVMDEDTAFLKPFYWKSDLGDVGIVKYLCFNNIFGLEL